MLANLSVGGDSKCFYDSYGVRGCTVLRHFFGDYGSPASFLEERALETAYALSGLLDQTPDL